MRKQEGGEREMNLRKFELVIVYMDRNGSKLEVVDRPSGGSYNVPRDEV